MSTIDALGLQSWTFVGRELEDIRRNGYEHLKFILINLS